LKKAEGIPNKAQFKQAIEDIKRWEVHLAIKIKKQLAERLLERARFPRTFLRLILEN
jgi:hypothetical protein